MGFSPKPRRPRGRPFAKGRSGNPGERLAGLRNKATLAAAAPLQGESEALTRRAVELALVGGAITPGEAEKIAAVADTFVPAIETSDFDRRLQLAEAGLAQHFARAGGISGDRPSDGFNFEERFCCRFAAGAAKRNNHCKFRL